MNLIARISNCLYNKLGLDPLGAFCKQEYSRQIQATGIGSQAHILQQLYQIPGFIRKIQLINIADKIAETKLVEFVYSGFCGEFVSVELIGKLEKPAQFFPGIDSPLICPAFQPDNPVFIKIRFINTFWHGEYNNNASGRKLNIFRLNRQGAPHMLAGCIADELIDSHHIL